MLGGRVACRARFGLDWRAIDYVARAAELAAPVLLIHGAADRLVPPRPSDELAARRPDLVSYLRLPGVGHVRGWNAGPTAYESAVAEFLESVVPGPDPRPHGALRA